MAASTSKRPPKAILRTVLVLLAALGELAQVHAQGSSAGGQEQGPDLDAVARSIIARTNDFRKKHGLAALDRDGSIEKAARDFAHFMAKTDKYGHTADGKRPSERIAAHGYEYCIAAENIAYAFRSSGFAEGALVEEFVQGWIHSPPHRKNMLNSSLRDIGVAVARSSDTGYYYAVQDFGRPRSAAIQFTVGNRSGQTVRYRVGSRAFSLAPEASRTHTECEAVELDFVGAGKRGQRKFEPSSGDRFVVSGSGGKLNVSKR